MLKIRLFGEIKIEYNGESLESKLGSKSIALIYLLIANKGRFISKDMLMYYLWPESSEDAARYNLRYNLWTLKKIIPPDDSGKPFITVNKDTCILNDKYPLKCDFLTIKEIDDKNAKIKDLLYAKELFCGNIMDGWYLKDCHEFNDLILADRIFCETRHAKIMSSLASKYEKKSDYENALEILIEASKAEPENEEIALRIMKLYVANGQRSKAINFYTKFKEDLQKSLDISPNYNMEEFYKTLCASNKTEETEVNLAEKNGDDIKIEVFCIGQVDYYVLSEIVSKLCVQTHFSIVEKLNKYILMDLSYISTRIYDGNDDQNGLLYLQSGTVPEVRILQAVSSMLETALKYYRIHIYVYGYEDIDDISDKMLMNLKKQKLEGLTVDYE